MHKILLADDVRVALNTEKEYLEGRNLKVYTTTSAREVLEMTGLVQPDLVVLEYEMPEMSGAEVCEQIRCDPRTSHIPVLIVSMSDDGDLSRRCQRAGCDGFLRRSEGRDRLLDEVARILGVPRRQDVRVPCEFTAGVVQGGTAFSGYVENISGTGLFLTTGRAFTPGMALRLSFDLPGGESPIRALAEVVRAEEITATSWGIGLKFLEMDEASRRSIEKFLGRCL